MSGIRVSARRRRACEHGDAGQEQLIDADAGLYESGESRELHGRYGRRQRERRIREETVPRINNNRLIPFTGQVAPYGTAEGVLLFGVGSKGAAVINDIRHSGESK